MPPAPQTTPSGARWRVPEDAADPGALAALQALRLRPRQALGEQQAASARWLVNENRGAAYDGAASAEPALVRELAARRAGSPPAPLGEAAVASLVAGERGGPADRVRMEGVARSADGREHFASFSALDGSATFVNARLVWLVGRLFGGWDVATQAGDAQPVVFRRGGAPLAVTMTVWGAGRRLESDAGPLRWVGGAPPLLPEPSAPYDGPLPPAPAAPEGGGDEAWLGARVGELVAAAGGEAGPSGWLVPTRGGVARLSVGGPSPHRERWALWWDFDSPRMANEVFQSSSIALSGKWHAFAATPAGVAEIVRNRLALFGLPPGLRPPPALLRLMADTGAGGESHRALWWRGRWRVAAVGDDSLDFLPGGHARRERAEWAARRLGVAARLRAEASRG